MTINTISARAPRAGMSNSSKNSPLKLASCKRRTDRASDGTIVAKNQMTDRAIPMTVPGPTLEPYAEALVPTPMKMFRMTPTAAETRTHHQYSLRLARPENVAYFLKNLRTATRNGAR